MPIVRFTMTMMPNCRSLIPSACAIGARIGTSTTTPGSGSMKMPKTRSSTLTANRNASGERFAATIRSVICCGTRDTVSTHANAADIATMISTDAVISAERESIAGSIRHSSDR
jgi:hypothetical protein